MKYLLLLIALIAVTSYSYGYDAAKQFETACATCHTIGGGDKIGPDLAGLGKRRSVEWIVKFVNYPYGMINGDAEEAGYEKADATAKALFDLYKPQMMTDQALTKDQVKAMIKFIDSKKKQPQGKILKLAKQTGASKKAAPKKK